MYATAGTEALFQDAEEQYVCMFLESSGKEVEVEATQDDGVSKTKIVFDGRDFYAVQRMEPAERSGPLSLEEAAESAGMTPDELLRSVRNALTGISMKCPG